MSITPDEVGDGARFDARAVRDTYDAVAEEYAAAFANDLDRLDLDREVLSHALALSPDGAVLDIGCGPGQVVGFATARHAGPVVGLDVSPGMLGVARRRGVDDPLVAADMCALPFRTRSFAAAIAFYSLQYVAPADTPALLGEIRSVLVPGGVVVLAVHLGEEVITGPEEWFGKKVPRVEAVLHPEAWWLEALPAAGFHLEAKHNRKPLPHESPTTRLYVIARSA